MYPKELALVAHYDQNANYYSSSAVTIFDRAAIDVKSLVVLDLGCGDGRTCFHLHERGAAFCNGVDYSATRIEAAQKQAQQRGLTDKLEFTHDNIHDYLDCLIQNQLKVDLVCLFEVLEHLEDPAAVLEKVGKVTRAVCGSVPVRHEYVAHLQVFPHIDDIVKLVGETALFTVKDGHVFFYYKTSQV